MHALLFSGFVVAFLVSCAAPPRPEEGASGSNSAASAVSDAEKTQAERTISSALTQGIDRYLLAPGDLLRFIYTSNRQAQQSSYVIGLSDKLRIEFFYHPGTTRTVVVRPDGRITLPVKGEVIAAGLTAEKLADRVRDLYQDIYRDPVVTVSVEEYSSPLTEINESLKTAQDGRSRQVVIAPDGLASLPLLPPFRAGGKTVEGLQNEVNQLYAERVGGVSVSLSLEKAAGDRVFVFGEVRIPGVLTVPRPQTTLQLITTAGGPLTTGAMDRVRVLYWTPNGESTVRTIDLEAVLDGSSSQKDMLVPANTVVYVPPTEITKLDRFIDQYIRQVFLFNGFSANMTYQLNPIRIAPQ